MILAAHQSNFIPWMSFFSKLNQCDIFVVLVNVQYEKNGWQNRCMVNGKYWTKPIKSGIQPISQKEYTDGQNVAELNMLWIQAIARTLEIDTNKIVFDKPTDLMGTEALIQLCKNYTASQYLTNPAASDKYLKSDRMKEEGIEIIPHESWFGHLHVFEAFNRWGISRTVEFLNREKRKFKASLSS